MWLELLGYKEEVDWVRGEFKLSGTDSGFWSKVIWELIKGSEEELWVWISFGLLGIGGEIWISVEWLGGERDTWTREFGESDDD